MTGGFIEQEGNKQEVELAEVGPLSVLSAKQGLESRALFHYTQFPDEKTEARSGRLFRPHS